MQIHRLLGYPVHIDSLVHLLDQLEAQLAVGHHQHVVTLNPEMLMRGEHDPTFGQILKQADIVLPDGAGVVWALKRRQIDVKRIPGIEFSEILISRIAAKGGSIALIGGVKEVNDATCQALLKRFPGLKISYAHHGFFQDAAEKDRVAQACATTRPNVVFVALGVPEQERWIKNYQALFTQPTAFVGVGGSFDIWSGFKKRAHPIFLKLNIEWLYRITSEPFRLKRVYRPLPMFVLKVLWDDFQHPKI